MIHQPDNRPENSFDTLNPTTRSLGLWDGVSIIVGTIIGAGIFENAPLVAKHAGGSTSLLIVWLVGGALAFVGALCFAELTGRFSDRSGGDYWFLRAGYGRPVAFLFGWASFWIIRPGNIGLMALTFGRYAHDIWPLRDGALQGSRFIYAVAAVTVLSAINLAGMRTGKITQNVLSLAKVLGIGTVIVIGFLAAPTEYSMANADILESASHSASWSDWAQALILVMFAYGGWNDLAFVSGEIKHPERNLFRSLLLGTGIVVLIYALLNWVFIRQLGYDGLAQSQSIGADLVQTSISSQWTWGLAPGRLFSILVCLSCLGAVNALLITSPRIYAAAGMDYRSLSWINAWSESRQVPWRSVIFQLLVTLGLLVLACQDEEPFSALVNATSPVFWSFLGLAFFSLGRIRRDQIAYTGFVAPGGIWLSLLMTFTCLAMSAASLHYLGSQGRYDFAFVVAAVLIGGIVAERFLRS